MRRGLRALAVAAAVALTGAGCVPITGAGSGSSRGPSGSPSASIDPNNLPVAYFDPARHQTWPDVGTMPDRTSATSSAKPRGFTSALPGAGMDRYLKAKLSWKPCDSAYQCADVVVPLDWDAPDGQAITLKLKKRQARGTRVGTMFINPGGPGGSGLDYVSSFKNEGFPGYDVIGWDPRGSGESTPVVCADDATMDKHNAVDMSPDSQAEMTALQQSQKSFAQQCRDRSGPLLDHISTIDTACDLDYLRHLVGDKKLTYLGVSYGTFIGSVYAELYPKRVGRLVLDSAVNITDKDAVIQASGFDLALKEFGTWCASKGPVTCPWGRTGDAVAANISRWFATLDSKPIKNLDQNKGVLGVATFLYAGRDGYSSLASALLFARALGEPQFLVTAAEFMMGKENGRYTSMAFAFPGISCADWSDKGAADAVTEWDTAKKKAPIFGTYMGPGFQCSYWTAKAAPALKLVGKGAAPILVLGATGDPATPYEQARWMAEQLDSGVLLTWKGAGHGVYSLGNECAKKAVEAYVVKGTVPADGTTC